ncbi:unnamed protein product [Prunus brigantina]
MANRKDKQKVGTSQSPQLPRILPASMSQHPVKTEPPSTIVPYPRHEPISVANRYSSLGTTVSQIPPNYQSAIVSSYDPFQLPASIASPSVVYPKTSPYFPSSSTRLFIIEPHIHNIQMPAMIAKEYFPPGFHFMPQSPYKSLKYYCEILHETCFIKPIRDKNDPHKTLYHSIYIHQILSQKSWGNHPYELRTLQSFNLQNNYFDYIEA